MEKYRKVKLSTIFMFTALICIFSYAMLEDTAISIPAFDSVKRPLLYLGLLCLVSQVMLLLKSLKKKKYFRIAAALVIFFAAVIISAVVNKHTIPGYSPLYGTFNLIVFITELFAVMIWAAERGKWRYVIRLLFYYVLILTAITDFLIFTDAVYFTDGLFETYLVGTKFSVAYLHIQLLALFLMNQRSRHRFKRRYILAALLYAIVVIFVADYVECNTGIIGCLFLMLLLILFNVSSDRWLRRFCTVRLFIIFMVFSVLFVFVYEMVLNLPFVKYMIVEVLDRTVTLTGRTEIYALYAIKMLGNWMWGFGYGGAYVMSMQLFGYADVQNALLQWVLQIGVIPVAALLGLFITIFRPLSRQRVTIQIMPALALIYVFLLLGTVEITMNMNFFLWIALIFLWINDRQRADEQR